MEHLNTYNNEATTVAPANRLRSFAHQVFRAIIPIEVERPFNADTWRPVPTVHPPKTKAPKPPKTRPVRRTKPTAIAEAAPPQQAATVPREQPQPAPVASEAVPKTTTQATTKIAAQAEQDRTLVELQLLDRTLRFYDANHNQTLQPARLTSMVLKDFNTFASIYSQLGWQPGQYTAEQIAAHTTITRPAAIAVGTRLGQRLPGEVLSVKATRSTLVFEFGKLAFAMAYNPKPQPAPGHQPPKS